MKKSLTLVGIFVVLAIAVLYFWRFHYLPKGQAPEPISLPDSLAHPEKEVRLLYEVPVDSFNYHEGRIKNNQNLGHLLSGYHMPEGSMQALITLPRDVFDLRKIRAGNKYVFLTENDSLQTLRYFIYEKNDIEYAKFCFGDSLEVIHGAKEVTLVQTKVSGAIESSLWNAMVNNGYDPMLANELSEVYAWSIDFFGLQAQDSFAIVYDQRYVDTLAVGLGKIYAAYFKHAGTEFYAIPFVQDSVESFYDEDGNSLKKAFLKAPLKFSRISSKFSNSRLHPVLKIRRPHHGVDYAAPLGTPVYAIGDGKIIAAKRGYNRGGGNMIKIRHNSVYTTAYLHLHGFAKGMKTGSYVKQGDLIGYVGSTGLSTGPHLDFRFYKNGKAIDPLKVEAPPVEPVHDSNLVAFDSVKAITLELLLD